MPKTGYGINVPITKQTDPRNFPDYEFREYPKAINIPVDKAYIEEWRFRNSYIDDRTGKTCYMGCSPRLGTMRELIATQEDVEAGYAKVVGEPVIVQNAMQEHDCLVLHGLKEAAKPAKAVAVPLADRDEELEQLRAENKRLKTKSDEQAEAEPPRRQYKRRRNRKNVQVVKDLSEVA